MWWNSQPQHLSRRSCPGWRRPHTHRKAPPPIHAILHEEDCELFVRIRIRITHHPISGVNFITYSVNPIIIVPCFRRMHHHFVVWVVITFFLIFVFLAPCFTPGLNLTYFLPTIDTSIGLYPSDGLFLIPRPLHVSFVRLRTSRQRSNRSSWNFARWSFIIGLSVMCVFAFWRRYPQQPWKSNIFGLSRLPLWLRLSRKSHSVIICQSELEISATEAFQKCSISFEDFPVLLLLRKVKVKVSVFI